MSVIYTSPEVLIEVEEDFRTVIVRSTRSKTSISVRVDPKTGGLKVSTTGKMSLGLHHGSPAIEVVPK